jgi:hypothetical protein
MFSALQSARALATVEDAETRSSSIYGGSSKMKYRMVPGAFLAMALLAGSVIAADDLKSGPQLGKSPTPFNPLHVTGPDAGSKNCPV